MSLLLNQQPAYSPVAWEPDTPWDHIRMELGIKINLLKESTDEGLKQFAHRSAIVCVLISNVMEETMPACISDTDTFRLLSDLYMNRDNLDFESEAICSWDAEGNEHPADPDASRGQLSQHMKALLYLSVRDLELPLTVGIVKKTHEILMKGAIDITDICPGEYRTSEAHSGTGFLFQDHTKIDSAMQEAIANYEKRLSDGEDGIVLIAQLIYRILVIHPFRNGNGRLCRLLACYGLNRIGVPFPVTLSSGHKRARLHYHQALKWADNHNGNASKLATLILASARNSFNNLTRLREVSRP